MDKKLAGLVGAVSTLALVGTSTAQAHTSPPSDQEVASYADLLKPIPNAKAKLAAEDAHRTSTMDGPASVQVAQDHHHHHHHHHHVSHHGHHRHHDM